VAKKEGILLLRSELFDQVKMMEPVVVSYSILTVTLTLLNIEYSGVVNQ